MHRLRSFSSRRHSNHYQHWQCLTGNQITSLRGILNGTCNFIITQVQETGASYDDILQEAQKRGYAGIPLDVNGADTTQKLSILSQLAFGVREDWERIPHGIDTLDIADIHFADRLGYRIKLLLLPILSMVKWR